MQSEYDLVIIGAGPAGRVPVHVLHGAGVEKSILVIKDEEIAPNRCAMPYGVSDKPLKKFMIPNTLVTDFGAELLIDKVDKIDTEKKIVHCVSGKEFKYEDAIIATGADPVVPNIPGIHGKNITPVRSKAHLETLREFREKFEKVVVVGGGYIGVELGAAFAEMGKDVTLVELLPQILANSLEPEFLPHIMEGASEHKLTLKLGSPVCEFLLNDKGEVCAVNLDDGTSIDAECVVLSIGVRPNSKVAKDSGIETSKFGIVVDEKMQTTAPHVYAAGDCVEKKSFITKKPAPGEFGTNAVFMGKVAAKNILGNEVKFPGVINGNCCEVFDVSFGSSGFTEKAAMQAGLNVYTGTSKVQNKYPMIEGVQEVYTKLIFKVETDELVGGSVIRKDDSVAGNVDFITLAIQMGSTSQDIAELQYCTHPRLAHKPSHSMFTVAAQESLKNKRRMLKK